MSLLFGCSDHDIKSLSPSIDLKTFAVDNSVLNQPISTIDLFYRYFKEHEVLDLPEEGIEIGTKNNVLDYAFITIRNFKGRFIMDDSEIMISHMNTPESIIKIFGEPYWTDRSDGEIIQFYEYNKGSIELQFEFSDSVHLSHVTFMVNGVLSTKEHRDRYYVDKPWPP